MGRYLGGCGNLPRGYPTFRRDLNITLEAADNPNDSRGRDPRSEQFRACMASSELQEMGLSDCVYTCRSSAHPHSLSRLDRFLSSSELLMEFPQAKVQALPRPLSDHTPIIRESMEGTGCPTYFKLDRSTLLGDSFKEVMAQWWATHPVDRHDPGGLANKLAGVCLSLKELQ